MGKLLLAGDVAVGEKLCQSDEAPSEGFGCEECCQRMDRIGRMYECLEQGRTYVSKHVSENVRHDDACCSELDVQFALQADQQSHRHGQYRKQQLVLDTSEPACKCHYRMQQGKYVDYPRSLYVMIESHRH